MYSVLITNPSTTSFGTKLSGSITNAGPGACNDRCPYHVCLTKTTVDAEISFETGLTISWSGRPLGIIEMPNIKVIGWIGAHFDVEANFEIADVDHLTEFTKVRVVSDVQRVAQR